MAAKNVDVPGTHKKPRKRTKDVVRRLKEQVEFYFGDMNLRKGFLRAKIDQTEDGFVPIKLVASFNRVKALTSDVSVLTSAMRMSDLLEVSADGHKVRRSTPLADPQDVDERTVYVEDLPPGTTIDSIKRHFSRCGSVEYIQLPRYWDSKNLKGFACVIFSKPEEALEALKVFDNFESGLEPLFPPKATTSNTQSSGSPSTVEVGGEGEGEGRGGVMVAGHEGQSSRSSRKRRRDDGDRTESNSDGKPSDVNNDDKPSDANNDDKPSDANDDDKRSDAHDDGKLSDGDGPPQAKVKKVEDVSHDEEGDAKANKKKNRKKRKKKTKENAYSYKVLHQLEFNRLKQVYLQLQKQEMSRAKKLLAEHSKSAPQPPSPAEMITTKAPAVAGGPEEMRAKPKRGADKIFKRLEETEFLKQHS